MAQVLVRGVAPTTLRKLKARARLSGRSLESELREILEEAAAVDLPEFLAAAARIRQSLAGRKHSDSGALQAEGRRR